MRVANLLQDTNMFMAWAIHKLLNGLAQLRNLLERTLFMNRVSDSFVHLITEEQYELYLMADPKIQIGSHVEHVTEESWYGEVLGLVFDDEGQVESISVWLDDGNVVDDYIEYWDHIEVEELPDNIIDAANRFGKKNETV
jgi:hypothetical protein